MSNHPLLIKRLKENDPTLTELSSAPGGKMDAEDFKELIDVAKNNPHIKKLVFWDNSFTDEEAALLSQLKSVEELQLNDNDITDEGLRNIVNGMPNLKRLNLYGNKVTDAGAAILAQSALEYLDLEMNDITDTGARLFLDNTTLRKLFLKGDEVSDMQAEAVEKYIEGNSTNEEKASASESKEAAVYIHPISPKAPKTQVADKELPAEVAESLTSLVETILKNPQCKEEVVRLFLRRVEQMPSQLPGVAN